MPGASGRFSVLMKAKINALLDGAEDPAETLDYSYRVQQETLQRVKTGITEVVASKKRLQRREDEVEDVLVRLDTQARQAMGTGDETLARSALERKDIAQTELRSLDQQIAELEDQQAMLSDSEQKLRLKVEAFRTTKEDIKAQYSTAEAQVRISDAATGVGEEMADIGLATQRALDKTEDMKARAGVISEHAGADTFHEATALGAGRDDVDRRLAELSSASRVDAEFAKLNADAREAPR